MVERVGLLMNHFIALVVLVLLENSAKVSLLFRLFV